MEGLQRHEVHTSSPGAPVSPGNPVLPFMGIKKKGNKKKIIKRVE